MMNDASLQLSVAQAITATAASTYIYDITGAGAGNAPPLRWGNSAVFGADISGADQSGLDLYFSVATSFLGAGATLQVQLQAAPDNGSNQPGTWITVDSTGPLTPAQLVAGYLQKLKLQPLPPGALARFYRLYYPVTNGPFTAGIVNAGIGLNVPTSRLAAAYPANYVAPQI
jgi:hypothetical protein